MSSGDFLKHEQGGSKSHSSKVSVVFCDPAHFLLEYETCAHTEYQCEKTN